MMNKKIISQLSDSELVQRRKILLGTVLSEQQHGVLILIRKEIERRGLPLEGKE